MPSTDSPPIGGYFFYALRNLRRILQADGKSEKPRPSKESFAATRLASKFFCVAFSDGRLSVRMDRAGRGMRRIGKGRRLRRLGGKGLLIGVTGGSFFYPPKYLEQGPHRKSLAVHVLYSCPELGAPFPGLTFSQ